MTERRSGCAQRWRGTGSPRRIFVSLLPSYHAGEVYLRKSSSQYIKTQIMKKKGIFLNFIHQLPSCDFLWRTGTCNLPRSMTLWHMDRGLAISERNFQNFSNFAPHRQAHILPIFFFNILWTWSKFIQIYEKILYFPIISAKNPIFRNFGCRWNTEIFNESESVNHCYLPMVYLVPREVKRRTFTHQPFRFCARLKIREL